jgi:hypothetical protein
MELADTLAVVLTVTRVLEGLAVPYLLGGSLASSLHGIPRSTQDADLVVDLQPEHIHPLVAALASEFYLDADRAADAVRRRASFNVIHLATMTKVDLFVLKHDPLSRQEMERRQFVELPVPAGARLPVATAEDIVLQKLLWFRAGGEVSDRQWLDLLGVLKVKRAELDLAYVERWAAELGLDELLRRALGPPRNGGPGG